MFEFGGCVLFVFVVGCVCSFHCFALVGCLSCFVTFAVGVISCIHCFYLTQFVLFNIFVRVVLCACDCVNVVLCFGVISVVCACSSSVIIFVRSLF